MRNSMSNKLLLLLTSAFALFFSALSTASVTTYLADEDAAKKDNDEGRVQVEWVNPKEYTDLKDGNFSSERYRKHAFSVFEKHLAELAEELPDGQRLIMKVTDIDLAGRIDYFAFKHQDVRIMRDIDIPRIKFEYSLVDAKGEVLKHEEVKLKDMSYLTHMRGIRADRPYSYEKRMLTRWFNSNFKNT